MKNLTAAVVIKLSGIELINTYTGLVESKVYSHDFGDLYVLDEIYGATTTELLESRNSPLSLIKIGKKYHLADRAKKIYSETPCSDKNYISYIAEDVMEVSNLTPTFIQINGKYYAGYKSGKIAYVHLPVDDGLTDLVNPEVDSVEVVEGYTSINGLVDKENKPLIHLTHTDKLEYMLGYDGIGLQLLVRKEDSRKAINITNAIKQSGDDVPLFYSDVKLNDVWTLQGLYDVLSL